MNNEYTVSGQDVQLAMSLNLLYILIGKSKCQRSCNIAKPPSPLALLLDTLLVLSISSADRVNVHLFPGAKNIHLQSTKGRRKARPTVHSSRETMCSCNPGVRQRV